MLEVNKIHQGDCIEVMKKLDDNSVDAIITDPPYELGFMGKQWDRKGIAFKVETWKECLRVLKAGGYLLSFGGTRTYHRMVCGIEDAGFEIRDTIMWLYGSGFPKSLNIGKQIDKMGIQNEKYVELSKELCDYMIKAREKLKLSRKDIAEYFPSKTGGITGCVWNWENGLNIPTLEQWIKLKDIYKLADDNFTELIEKKIKNRIEAEREVIGNKESACFNSCEKDRHTIGASKNVNVNITLPSTEQAKKWEGWGTALKPACEPIVVARKPLSEKNVALNVLKHGTGGINIDESRIVTDDNLSGGTYAKNGKKREQIWGEKAVNSFRRDKKLEYKQPQGRFPANIILDEEAGKMLDEQSGVSKSCDTKRNRNTLGSFGMPNDSTPEYSDKGGASRFFYCAKASKSERNMGCEELLKQKTDYETTTRTNKETADKFGCERKSIQQNIHPTVKPIKLMEYLIKLITRKDAIVLDPFIGSGTTAIACLNLNRKFIGIEQSKKYIKIANARIKPFIIKPLSEF